MTLVEEGNIGVPTVIEMEHKGNIKEEIERHMSIVTEHIAEALAKGNEIVMRAHNDKIFIYELEYKE